MTDKLDIHTTNAIDEADYERYLLKNPYKKAEKRAKQARDPEQAVEQPDTLSDPALLPRPRRRFIRVIVVAMLALVVVVGAGLGVYKLLLPLILPPDISAYANQGITIAGLESEDFIVTPAELLGLEIITESATGTGGGQAGESKTGTITSYGPYMETFLQSHGHTLTDFGRIRILCKDGYSVTYRPELLEGAIIMSVADNHSPLAHYQQPLRMVIPGDKTGNWAFGVLRIEFVQ